MCLAIPGRIVEFDEADQHLALVDVSGVRRKVNVDLLQGEPLERGDWILIHVGFAMSRISEDHAREQLRLLAMLGEDRQAMQELEGYEFGQNSGRGEHSAESGFQDASGAGFHDAKEAKGNRTGRGREEAS